MCVVVGSCLRGYKRTKTRKGFRFLTLVRSFDGSGWWTNIADSKNKE